MAGTRRRRSGMRTQEEVSPEDNAAALSAILEGERPLRPLRLRQLTPEFAFTAGFLMMTQEEIGALFDVLQPAVSKRLAKPDVHRAWKAGQATAKMSLRRAQFKQAIDEGNVTAQIWLGKQYLDQRDSVKEIEQKSTTQITYIAKWGGQYGELEAPAPGEAELIEGEVEDEEEE